LEYFTAIWYNLWPFGIVCSHLVYFSRFGMLGPRKIWQPCLAAADPRKFDFPSNETQIELDGPSDEIQTLERFGNPFAAQEVGRVRFFRARVGLWSGSGRVRAFSGLKNLLNKPGLIWAFAQTRALLHK
jgi:hypothetical protein